MARRFRKSIKIAKEVRLNLSKSEVGVSVGGKAFRVGVDPRGAYTSTSIPGTGLYNIEYFGQKGRERASAQVRPAAEPQAWGNGLPPEMAASPTSTGLGCLVFTASVVLLFIWWPLGLAGLAGLALWAGKSGRTPEGQARAWYRKGREALNGGNREVALEAFSKAVELKPEAYSVYRELGLIYQSQGRGEEAAASFEKYLAAYPGDAVVSLQYAACLVGCERYREAAEMVQKLYPEVRETLPALNILASAFLDQKQPELALAVLEKGPGRSRKPLDEQGKLFRYLLGLTYKELGQAKKALKQFYRLHAEDAGYQDVVQLIKELNPSFEDGEDGPEKRREKP